MFVHLVKRSCIAGFVLMMLMGFCDAAPAGKGYRAVRDSRGREIRVPEKINRVVTVSDGLVAGVMSALGEADKIVGLGSGCIPKQWHYEYPTVSGETYDYTDGMNTVTFLNPSLMELPLVARSGSGINYEALAGLDPDVVIIRAGSCSLSGDRATVEKSIGLIESLGIPLIVLHGPNTYENPHIRTLSEEIRIIGRVFGKESRAGKIAGYLESQVNLVKERTAAVSESERKSVLLLGLSPKARKQGGAGHVKGLDTIQSKFVEEFVHARNAFREKGGWKILGPEQVMALDPDVIVLITSWGYHPPRELYEAPYYRNLGEMRAVKNRGVSALPWTPCNCEKRLEYPVDVMVTAMAAYPELFRDMDLAGWLLEFYMNLYGVDRETAKQLRSRQWMDWTLER